MKSIQFELARPWRAAAAVVTRTGGALGTPLAAIGRPFDAVARAARDYSRGFLAWSVAPATTLAAVRGEIARLTEAERSRRTDAIRRALETPAESRR